MTEPADETTRTAAIRESAVEVAQTTATWKEIHDKVKRAAADNERRMKAAVSKLKSGEMPAVELPPVEKKPSAPALRVTPQPR